MRKTVLACIAAIALTSSSAMACAPSPSCWSTEGKDYLKSVCGSMRKMSLAELTKSVEEPKDLPAFARNCKKIGIVLKDK